MIKYVKEILIYLYCGLVMLVYRDSKMNQEQKRKRLSHLGDAVAIMLAWPFLLAMNIAARLLLLMFHIASAIYFGPIVLSQVYYRQKWKEQEKARPKLEA